MTELTPAPPTPTKPHKAILGFLAAFGVALLASVQGRPTLEGMGLVDWLIVVGGALVTGGTVWAKANPPADGRRRRDQVGESVLGIVLVVLLAVLLVLLILRLA